MMIVFYGLSGNQTTKSQTNNYNYQFDYSQTRNHINITIVNGYQSYNSVLYQYYYFNNAEPMGNSSMN